MEMRRKIAYCVGVSFLLLVGALLLIVPSLMDTYAQSCAQGDATHVVVRGDTLWRIADGQRETELSLQQYNHIANINLIYVGQKLCIPGKHAHTTHVTLSVQENVSIAQMAIAGLGDPFPYGQCTWWASYRYWQLHGVFVPWTINSNAAQWVARAFDFHWQVSSAPRVGSIVVLQPYTQGAFSLGHVAVVERDFGNGEFLASSMNWNGLGAQVAYSTFSVGPGVSFLSY